MHVEDYVAILAELKPAFIHHPLTLADRDSSNPDPLKPASRSRWAWASEATRWQIQPTDRHAIRISSDTAVLLV